MRKTNECLGTRLYKLPTKNAAFLPAFSLCFPASKIQCSTTHAAGDVLERFPVVAYISAFGGPPQRPKSFEIFFFFSLSKAILYYDKERRAKATMSVFTSVSKSDNAASKSEQRLTIFVRVSHQSFAYLVLCRFGL